MPRRPDYPGPYLRDAAAQVVTGMQLPPGRIALAQRWRQYFAGQLDGLFARAGNDINGLQLLIDNKPDIIRLNYFRAVTRALVDALFAERPRLVGGEATDLADWLHQLEIAVEDASSTGLGVLVQGEDLYAAAPEYAYPELGGDGSRITGWLICQPYRHYESLSDEHLEANRVQAAYFPQEGLDVAWVRDYVLEGTFVLGAMLREWQVAAASVSYFGPGRSEYADLESVVRELLVRTTLQSRAINRYSSPHMQGPAGAQLSGRFQLDARGRYLPVDEDTGVGYSYVTWDPAGQSVNAHIERLREDFYLLSATPASALGLNTGSGSGLGGRSGLAEERALFPFLSKVRRYRAWMESVMEDLTGRGFHWQWPDDPLLGWRDKVESEALLVQSGMITAAEARGRLMF